MPFSPRVLLGPLIGLDLAMTYGRISGGGSITAEVINMLYARLLPGCAADYDVRHFEVYPIIIASDLSVLVFAVREVYALYPNTVWL